MLDAMELDAAHSAACVYESPEVTGTVSTEGAAATGLRPGTPVVAGGGDQAAGAVGMGIVRAGAVSATIGTSGVVFAATDRPALDPGGRVHTFCHAVPGRWHIMGVTQGAGLSLRWFRDQFGAGADDGRDPYERLTEEAARVPAGGRRRALGAVPDGRAHAAPRSARARRARGARRFTHARRTSSAPSWKGSPSASKTPSRSSRRCRCRSTGVRLGGGGARSALWRQIQADIYGYPVEIVEAEEGAAYGAALLAGVGGGVWRTVDDACDAVVRVATRVDARSGRPGESWRRQYEPSARFTRRRVGSAATETAAAKRASGGREAVGGQPIDMQRRQQA